MTTALDLLMSTKEDVNLLSEESDICTIDAKTRVIFVPSTIVVGGVQSDKNAERIKFSCPKIVGDNLDLSKFSVRINFENVSSVDFNVSIKDQYICDDVAVDGENITFSWLIGRNAARYMGTVRFIVCAVKTDSDSNISVEWNTTIAEVPVLEGIEIDYPQIGQEEKDVINQLLELTKNTSAEAVQNVNSAKEQAIKDIQSVSQPDTTLTIEGGLAEAKATGEAIGSLKEDLVDLKNYGIFEDNLSRSNPNGLFTNINAEVVYKENGVVNYNSVSEAGSAYNYCGFFYNREKFGLHWSPVFLILAYNNDEILGMHENGHIWRIKNGVSQADTYVGIMSGFSLTQWIGNSNAWCKYDGYVIKFYNGNTLYNSYDMYTYFNTYTLKLGLLNGYNPNLANHINSYNWTVTDFSAENYIRTLSSNTYDSKENDSKPTKGLYCNILGDSITSWNVFPPLLKQKLGLAGYNNCGVAETSVAREWYMGTDRTTSTNAFCERYVNMPTKYIVNGESATSVQSESRVETSHDIDFIIIFGGTNDFSKGNKITWQDSRLDDDGNEIEDPSGTETPNDIRKLSVALDEMFSGLQTRWGNKPIFYVTPTPRNYQGNESLVNGIGHTLKDYRDCIIEKCSEYNINYYDAFTQSGLTRANIYTWGADDGLHFNNNGAERFATSLANYILQQAFNN